MSQPAQTVAAAATCCRGCGVACEHAARYCPECGNYLNPHADRVARRVDADDRWRSVGRAIAFYVAYLSTILVLAAVPAEQAVHAEMLTAWLDAALVLACAWLMGVPVLRAMLCNARGLGYLGLGVALLAPLLMLNMLYHGMLQQVLGVEMLNYWAGHESANHGLATAVLYVCVMPAIVEEIAFRGIIQGNLQRVVRPAEALVLTAVLFAIIHVSLLSGPYLCLVGLLLGWLRLRSGSLLPCIVVHFLHNFAVLMTDYSDLP